MVRVKRGKTAHKKREKLLKYTKGFNWGRKSKERAAKEALLHAWSHAYDDRKKKKRDNRGLWQVKVNAASRELGISYSKLTNQLKKKNININRKMLAELASDYPKIFKAIVNEASK